LGEHKQTEMISIELLTDVRLPVYLKYIKKNDYMHFISHPKMLNNYNINIFKKILTKFVSKYEYETDFRKILKAE